MNGSFNLLLTDSFNRKIFYHLLSSPFLIKASLLFFPLLLSLVSETVSILFGFCKPLCTSLIPCSTHGFSEIISSDQTVSGLL